MQHYMFVIGSGRDLHQLSLNGNLIGTFATLSAAEAEATRIAQRAVPGATLEFDLDFKWTLSNFEIRAAALDFVEENRPC